MLLKKHLASCLGRCKNHVQFTHERGLVHGPGFRQRMRTTCIGMGLMDAVDIGYSVWL